jgi:ATP-dependent Clp protease ATP-binding subunit ClpC
MKEGPVIDIFHRLNLNLQMVKTELETKVREDELGMPIHTSDLVLNEKASNILKLAVLEARIQRTDKVNEQHLLLAILHDQVKNGAKEVLEFNDMNYNDVLALLHAPQQTGISDGIGLPDEDYEEEEETGGAARNSSNKSAGTTTAQTKAKSNTPVLDTFGTNLTQAATEGKLDPCVGREREIQRVIEILGRRKKNNPILIGEPGVGKSAIVEGLAQMITQHHTSPMLFNKKIYTLDMTAIVAGTKYRGQFEERLRQLMKELEQNDDIIVFIDCCRWLNEYCRLFRQFLIHFLGMVPVIEADADYFRWIYWRFDFNVLQAVRLYNIF